MIFWENIGSRTDTVFCGVFDGHGSYGHMVAKKVRDSLPLKLSVQWEVRKSSDDVLREINLNTAGSMNAAGSIRSEHMSFLSADEESRPSVDLEETEKHPEIFQSIPGRIRDIDVDLDIDVDCSKEDEMNSGLGIDWSALEGVSRVNTLLNLPRFDPGK